MAETDDRNTYRVERSITIAAPIDDVFARIADFHRWTDWSPWEGLDQNMQRRYEGVDAGVGAIYEWEGSRKVGKGRMEIVDADEPTSVGIELDFIKPFKSKNDCRFAIRADGAATTVTWTMTGPKTFATKVMSIFTSMDKIVGRDFEKGLTQLKVVSER